MDKAHVFIRFLTCWSHASSAAQLALVEPEFDADRPSASQMRLAASESYAAQLGNMALAGDAPPARANDLRDLGHLKASAVVGRPQRLCGSIERLGRGVAP